LLRIEEEALLKDQKITFLEQPGPAFLNFRLQIKNSAIRIPHSAIRIGRESKVYRVAFEKEKELTDRTLNLAEVGKPKSNWELQGLLGLAVFVLGFLAGK
jgi:hypothetical protein